MKGITCPVCKESISARSAQGRRSGKTFVMLVCPKDGRHFRGFITDQKFVDSIINREPKKKG